MFTVLGFLGGFKVFVVCVFLKEWVYSGIWLNQGNWVLKGWFYKVDGIR